MNLEQLISKAGVKLINTGQEIKSHKWQAQDLVNPMFETIKVYLGPAEMPNIPGELEKLTKANLPWAEDHFQERISGMPSNPGEQYKNWPYWHGQKEMMAGEYFSHTYQERFWPKHANNLPGHVPEYPGVTKFLGTKVNTGIRYALGDLEDVIQLLISDPHTRQAYLPIFFPEDTGAAHKQRVPCTLGYLFQYRNGLLHMTYYIRSCDYIRHFRDDIYMAVRLAQYIKNRLYIADPTGEFSDIALGAFDMHIGSLHVFKGELKKVNDIIYGK